MEALRITATLGNALAVSDDWSPSLDALLIKFLLDERGLGTGNPTIDDVAMHQSIVDAHMPIKKGTIGNDWYWQTSSPCYLYESEQIERIHGRWDCQDKNLDWEGKRRKWTTSEGAQKAWTILIPERITPRIDWYCTGDADEILRILSLCDAIGKKKRTQVTKWEATEWYDWHLWDDSGRMMRPMPSELMNKAPLDFAIRTWAWRPPTHLPENRANCIMPIGNARRVRNLYGIA